MTLVGFQNFLKFYKFNFNNIILTGGGRKNTYLLNILKNNINKKINLIDNLKINGDLVEAKMF